MRLGCKKMTVSKLSATPLASTSPRSAPISNFMKNSARKPPTVVSADAAIVEKVLGIAFCIARRLSSVDCFSSSYWCIRKIA